MLILVGPAPVSPPPAKKEPEPVPPPPMASGPKRAQREQSDPLVDGSETAQRLMFFAEQVSNFVSIHEHKKN